MHIINLQGISKLLGAGWIDAVVLLSNLIMQAHQIAYTVQPAVATVLNLALCR